MLLYIESSKVPARACTLTPPHPSDDDQFEAETDERGPHHWPGRRRHDRRLDVEGIPERETALVAALAREAVPHRERNRNELTRGKRRRRFDLQRPLEDHRPLALVV